MNDVELQDAVYGELEWDPKVDPSGISVQTQNGAVSLTGYVTSFPQKLAAVRAAERVYGVKAVADDIAVTLSPSGAVQRTDARIAEEIARERDWNTLIPDSVEVEVSSGHVTLRGEVEWSHQRDDAVRAVRHLAGVRGVTNLITLKPHAKAEVADLENRIEAALERMADLDARSIWATVSDGTVRLNGSVHSLAERRIAQRAAESAPGVKEVENEIVVT